MDIWVKAPSDRKGLNGMNRPCAVSMALYHLQQAVLELAENTLKRQGEQQFGIVTFENVSIEDALPLCRALYDYAREYGLHRHITFYFGDEVETVANKERDRFRSIMMNRYSIIVKDFRMITNTDIDRERDQRERAIDEFTEAAENSLIMPSHPEREG
jgi:hypothetical protein